MKKLKLKALEFGATEALTRAQLKKVLGGGGSGSGGGYCVFTSDCQSGFHCFNSTCVPDTGSGCSPSCPPGWRCLLSGVCVLG